MDNVTLRIPSKVEATASTVTNGIVILKNSEFCSLMTQSQRIRVVLADDHNSFRQSLIASIPDSSPIEIVAEAADGEAAVTVAYDLKPDVVLLDFRMPGLDGAAAAVRILQQSPPPMVLVTSLSFDRQYLLRSLSAGASGYVAKDDAYVCLPQAIESVQAGSYYLSARVQQALSDTAPANPSSIAQRLLQDFDKEAEALLACAQRIASSDAAARDAMYTAFLAYSLALREGEIVQSTGVQTWLLFSVTALTGSQHNTPFVRWSWWQDHPSDSKFEAYWISELSAADSLRMRNHVAGCGSCRLAWSLAAFSTSSDKRVLVASMRDKIANSLDNPDEAAVFLAYALRQFKVMQLASTELERLLGATARRDWTQRQASAGAWLGALLGKTTAS
jgi:DNA-binding NarL/FixJ family response regulator